MTETQRDAILAKLDARFHPNQSPARRVPVKRQVVAEQPFVSEWRQRLQEGAARAKAAVSRKQGARTRPASSLRRESASQTRLYMPLQTNPEVWKPCKCGVMIRLKAERCRTCFVAAKRVNMPERKTCACGKVCGAANKVGKCRACMWKRVCVKCDTQLARGSQGKFCSACLRERQGELGRQSAMARRMAKVELRRAA